MDEMLRLGMTYLRQHVPDVPAAARAQRWDPAEVLPRSPPLDDPHRDDPVVAATGGELGAGEVRDGEIGVAVRSDDVRDESRAQAAALGRVTTFSSDLLTSRRALVTGGTRGIGAATARLLADAGAQVVVSAPVLVSNVGGQIRRPGALQ